MSIPRPSPDCERRERNQVTETGHHTDVGPCPSARSNRTRVAPGPKRLLVSGRRRGGGWEACGRTRTARGGPSPGRTWPPVPPAGTLACRPEGAPGRVGDRQHRLWRPRVALGECLSSFISPRLSLPVCGTGRTAAPASEGSSTRSVALARFDGWCPEQHTAHSERSVSVC